METTTSEKRGRGNKTVLVKEVTCVVCNGSFPYKTVELTDELMGKVSEIPNFSWSCDDCLIHVKNLKVYNELNAKQREMKEELVGLKVKSNEMVKEISVLSDKNEKKFIALQSAIVDISKDLKASLNKSWAEVAGEMKNKVQEVNREVSTICKTIEKTSDGIKINNDLEERMHNIIIYQLKQCKDNDKVICNSHDRKQILEICSQLSDGYIKESSIKSIFRLGVRSDKVRPVMVKFYDKRDRNIVMENLKKIKGLSSSLRCIGVNYDLNKEQRDVFSVVL
ncbi:hypothetical protein HELRODRAFT_158598 [Helobdella robusta]|uniref:Uncharacterized protein n=1 Tax=Helobdella robusta TaxID=6412 RepID=T1EN01_HELRO|nr:hypothetical protein HELRODRAFT_158598 [Helobdella robusta]ESO12148.1 hypothetical protein HELRODRAFT_158598 [Helobdella robusta]